MCADITKHTGVVFVAHLHPKVVTKARIKPRILRLCSGVL